MLKIACFALAAIFVGAAAAQYPVRPDPADPKVAVPSRPYESVFRDYRPYADPDVARWRYNLVIDSITSLPSRITSCSICRVSRPHR